MPRVKTSFGQFNSTVSEDVRIPDVEKTKPEVEGEESESGHMSNPEEVEECDALELAQKVGLYRNATDESPEELGIGEQINSNEAEEWQE